MLLSDCQSLIPVAIQSFLLEKTMPFKLLMLIGDMIGLSLLRYDFSLDDCTITFTFSEAINNSTLNIDELLIQSHPNISEDGVITFMLNSGTPNLLTTQVVS